MMAFVENRLIRERVNQQQSHAKESFARHKMARMTAFAGNGESFTQSVSKSGLVRIWFYRCACSVSSLDIDLNIYTLVVRQAMS